MPSSDDGLDVVKPSRTAAISDMARDSDLCGRSQVVTVSLYIYHMKKDGEAPSHMGLGTSSVIISYIELY